MITSRAEFFRFSYRAAAFALAAFCLQAGLFTGAAAAATVDRIVATVNGEIITLSQLNRRADPVIKMRRLSGAAADEARRQILEAIIDQQLASQEARKLGLSISDGEVDRAVQSVMEQYKINLEQLKAGLQYQGTTLENFREDIRLEILKSKVLAIQVRQKVVVTDAEVSALLKGETTLPDGTPLVGGLFTPAEVRIIYLPITANNARAIKKVLDEGARIKAEIDAGLSFAEAAAKYSQGPGRDQGGDPGQGVMLGDLDARLRKAAEGLAPGQVSEPVALDQVVALIMLPPPQDGPTQEAPAGKAKKSGPKRQGKKVDLSNYSQAEIDRARTQLMDIKVKAKFDDWVSDLKNKSIVRIML